MSLTQDTCAKIKTKQTEHITEDYMYRLKTVGQLSIVSRIDRKKVNSIFFL